MTDEEKPRAQYGYVLRDSEGRIIGTQFVYETGVETTMFDHLKR